MLRDNTQFDDAWLGLGDLSNTRIINPLYHRTTDDLLRPGMHEARLMRRKEYLHMAASMMCDIQLLPAQAAILEELWQRPFPMYIASRGYGKSWLLGVYAMLRCLLIPKTKIVIVGAAFRQSKIIFEYMETIWRNSPVLRSVCAQNSGPRRETDRCTMRINDSWAIAVPLGNGDKIRGLRANTILSDEFNCVDKNTLVETDSGLVRIKDLMYKSEFKVINKDGELEKPAKNIITPPCDVYEIQTQYGYSFKCSENHIVMTHNGWKKAIELDKSDYLILENQYRFPATDTVDTNLAWLMGVLVAEGTITQKDTIDITTTDVDFAYRCTVALTQLGLTPRTYIKKAYQDLRGWKCKQSYNIRVCDQTFRTMLYDLGLDFVTSHNKQIPWSILQSSKPVVVAFLSGLFEGDGSCFTFKSIHHSNILAAAYYTVSEVLAHDLQTLMLKFDIVCQRQTRKSQISVNPQWMLRFSGSQALSLINLLQVPLWKDIAAKAYMKVDQCLAENPRGFQVKSVQQLSNQEVLYDFHLPDTHSFYGNGFVQHNSIPPDIYETVVAGFTAVSADPVQNVKEAARRKAMQDAGSWQAKDEYKYLAKRGNQAIISGTAGYDFGHFADYWKRYCGIINSKGDPEKLGDIFGEHGVPSNFDWRDYSVIRIPYELVPEGFMDDKQIARARATIHTGIYNSEYGAVFSKDSDGFFKRSLIESCVTSDVKPIVLNKTEIYFDALTSGNSSLRYVYGIDPASEEDNFSIIILELHNDHTRIVYCWTTNRKDFKSRVKAGLVKEHDFYGFCARKIRDLMKTFPCDRIGMDAQGGGIAVEEALHDPEKLQEGEILIWPVIDEDKEKDTDIEPGLHILELVQFAKYEWTSEANHGLRKDFEDKVLLFSRFDPVTLAMSVTKDSVYDGNIYDSLEDCVMEIEELKDELSTITLSRTGTGVNSRDRWDTPEIKLSNGKKGRLRKDRYSALVIANMLARQLHREKPGILYGPVGGWAKKLNKDTEGQFYQGPEWFTKQMGESTCFGVLRGDGVQ